MKRFSIGWAVLIALLLAVLVSTLVSERAARAPESGEEPTYALQAASLAWDFDLAYDEQDYRRFVEQWGVRPPGIDLESRDGGRTQVYGRPFFHALVAAPFVRVMPDRGMRFANALLLAVAALLTARTLALRFGSPAPLWVAVFVFASVMFAYVFLATADLFLVAVTAAGFALVYSEQTEPAMPQVYQGSAGWSWGVFGRWAGIGLLLAIPGAYRPPYLLLLVPAALAVREILVRTRLSAWAGLALGAGGSLLLASMVHTAAGGDPLWSLASLKPEPDPGLLVWNAVYLLIGRSVGILPYFLPVLLALAAYRKGEGRGALLACAALASVAFLLLRPYDFAGIADTPGNRLFLPLYAALWFLPARPRRLSWALVAAVAAVPFLAPVWLGTRSPEVLARVVERLPYETTQRDLPGDWVSESGIRIKPTTRNVWQAEQGSGFRVAGDVPGSLVVASEDPLKGLVLDFDRNSPTLLKANGAELRPTLLRADGSVSFEIPLGSARAHPMWWTGRTWHVYPVSFSLPDAPARPLGFRVHPARDLIQKRP